jgi:aspartate carbamoyltransferase catalytic subunit
MLTLSNARLVDPEGDRIGLGGLVIADGLIAEVFEDMREGLAGADVVMMLRLQKERMDGALVPSMREYYHRFGLDAEKLASAKPDAIVMHPGPMNRGVEIDGLLADDINVSVIQEQVEMGVAVRMAAMDLLARNQRARNAPGGTVTC